jgi:osmotically inducible protein OsmC
MLQSKAGIENREYKAQRAILADVDAGKISKEDLLAHAEQLMKVTAARCSCFGAGDQATYRRSGCRGACDASGTDRKRACMKRTGSAVWKGGLKDGRGTVSTSSGVLSSVPYNFGMRFENEKGTNPEELIAAAHAACFSMALSAQLGNAGMTADSIDTTATVTLDKVEGGFAVTESHLQTTVKIPNADKAAFETAANNAKSGCPISKLLNAKITLDAKLA